MQGIISRDERTEGLALMRRHETMGDLAEQGFTRDQVLDTLRILPFVSVNDRTE